MASVAFLVKTISPESDALIKAATFFLANSYSSVALALHSEHPPSHLHYLQKTKQNQTPQHATKNLTKDFPFKQNPHCIFCNKHKLSTLDNESRGAHLNCKLHNNLAKHSIQQSASEKSRHCLSTQVLNHLLPKPKNIYLKIKVKDFVVNEVSLSRNSIIDSIQLQLKKKKNPIQ